MKSLKILAPIAEVNDIKLVSKTRCKSVYIYHSCFLDKDDYKLVFDFINKAKEHELEFYINFKTNIQEEEIEKVKGLIDFLEECPIDGILVNNLDILEFIKDRHIPFKVIIDSGLNIHNLSGIEFVNLFHQIENINITEEIYLKNLVKIKKYTKYKLSIDTDNLPWIADQIIKNKAIDVLVIKGNFENSKELISSITLIEKIINNPKVYKNKKLPFKHLKNSNYISNHFSGEFINAGGRDFKFAGNIKQFKWDFKRVNLPKKINPEKTPKLCLRLTSLEQVKSLKSFLRKLRYNPVHSIEYGEILNTADLAKYSFNRIIEKIKKDCFSYGIKLQLSTPRVLIERDFDRVYEYVKLLCVSSPYPSSIVVNNIGYWWTLINDSELESLPVELGQGLNLLNSSAISCLANQHSVSTIDLSNFTDINSIKKCVDELKSIIPNRKLTIAGNVRIPSLGLCPLNTDTAILSRLSCAAPCHHGNYSVLDPTINKQFPIAVDGFCRMHLYQDKIMDLFKHINFLQSIGINEFVIDFSGLPANLVPILLNRFLIAINSDVYEPDPNFVSDQYEIEKSINLIES